MFPLVSKGEVRGGIRVHAIDETRNNNADEAKVFEVQRHGNSSPAPIVRILGCSTVDEGGREDSHEWDDESEETVLRLSVVRIRVETSAQDAYLAISAIPLAQHLDSDVTEVSADNRNGDGSCHLTGENIS